MNAQFLMAKCIAIAITIALTSTSCVTGPGREAVENAQAAATVRNDGGLAAGKTRPSALAELRALQTEFGDNARTQSDVRFRIAMLQTTGGLRRDAEAAWAALGADPDLTTDQEALFRTREALMFLFSRPNGETRSLENRQFLENAEKPSALSAIEGFQGIAEDRKVSSPLRVYGAYHRAYLAWRLRKDTPSSDAQMARVQDAFAEARTALETLWAATTQPNRSSVAGTDLERKIEALRAKESYRSD